MKNIICVVLILGMASLWLGSCQKDDANQQSQADAQVRVKVVNKDGEKISGIKVKMYDEATYPLFEKDNTVQPNLTEDTNTDGIATFNLNYNIWIGQPEGKVFMFVVQFGQGTVNYQIWSSGKTIKPGSREDIEIKLTNYPSEPEQPGSLLVSKVTVTTDEPGKPVQQVIAFTYDDKYQVKHVTWLNNEVLDYSYTQTGMDLTVTNTGNQNYVGNYHFEPNNSNFLSLEMTDTYRGIQADYQMKYDTDGFLQEVIYTGEPVKATTNYIWSEGNLLRIERDGIKYPYNRPSEYPNNTNIDLSVIISGYINYIDLSYAALIKKLGKPSKQVMERVPTSLYDYQYTYTADTGGYLQEITKKTTDKEMEKVYTTTYSIEYQNK